MLDLRERVDRICKEFNINNYFINSDGSIDVKGDVNLSFEHLSRLPLKFNKVDGYFSCSHNVLTSLEGAPIYVSDSFSCNDNKLSNLKHMPKYIGSYLNCIENDLESLEGIHTINGHIIADDDLLIKYNRNLLINDILNDSEK